MIAIAIKTRIAILEMFQVEIAKKIAVGADKIGA